MAPIHDNGHPEGADNTARTIADVVERFSQLPILDRRSPEDIVGYDVDGAPA